MKLNGKRSAIVLFALLALGLIAFLFCRPAQPKLIVPLADGSRFVLEGTDVGRRIVYGGGSWQRVICKTIRHPLPSFVHYQPTIWPSFYTNGVGLSFRREWPDKSALATAWNGDGQLYFLDSSGAEHQAPFHAINFQTETRKGQSTVVAEDIYWELPISPEPELRLRMRETNSLTGAVSTHDFSIKNPVK
jgi:hypothetical protein